MGGRNRGRRRRLSATLRVAPGGLHALVALARRAARKTRMLSCFCPRGSMAFFTASQALPYGNSWFYVPLPWHALQRGCVPVGGPQLLRADLAAAMLDLVRAPPTAIEAMLYVLEAQQTAAAQDLAAAPQSASIFTYRGQCTSAPRAAATSPPLLKKLCFCAAAQSRVQPAPSRAAPSNPVLLDGNAAAAAAATATGAEATVAV